MQKQRLSFGYSYQSMAGTLGEVLQIDIVWRVHMANTACLCYKIFDLKVKVPQTKIPAELSHCRSFWKNLSH